MLQLSHAEASLRRFLQDAPPRRQLVRANHVRFLRLVQAYRLEIHVSIILCKCGPHSANARVGLAVSTGDVFVSDSGLRCSVV